MTGTAIRAGEESVVAEGAADPSVRLSLQRAVQAVTGVSLSCIEVFEMNYPS